MGSHYKTLFLLPKKGPSFYFDDRSFWLTTNIKHPPKQHAKNMHRNPPEVGDLPREQRTSQKDAQEKWVKFT
jgi:hypothetical protein